MLCAISWQAIQETRGLFEELRELCTAAGDKVSLAIGMTGLETELMFAARTREGSRLASEQMALLFSIDDPAPTVGLAFIAFNNWFDAGEFGEILRWSDIVIDLADGDPAKGLSSVSDRRWRQRWPGAALRAGGWAVLAGVRT